MDISINDVFVDAHKHRKQSEIEDHFRGKVLSKFAKIEQITLMMIEYQFKKTRTSKFQINENNMRNTKWKLDRLTDIFENKKYSVKKIEYCKLLEKIKQLKKIRDQFAHNIIFPGSTFTNTKDGKSNITMIFRENNKWVKKNFTKKQQEKLDEDLYLSFRRLREAHRFIGEQYDEHLQLTF